MSVALFAVPAVLTLLVIVYAFVRQHAAIAPQPPPKVARQVLWVVAMTAVLTLAVAPSRAVREAGYAFLEVIFLPAPGYCIVFAFLPLVIRRHPRHGVRLGIAGLAAVLLAVALVWSDAHAQMLANSRLGGVILYGYWAALLVVNGWAALRPPAAPSAGMQSADQA
jgi:hypothetical protein